jgi:hypothetical protein
MHGYLSIIDFAKQYGNTTYIIANSHDFAQVYNYVKNINAKLHKAHLDIRVI